MGLFSLEKRRLREDLSDVCKYLKAGSQVNGAGLFSVVRRREVGGGGKGHKSKQKRFRLNMRKGFSSVRTAQH